MKGNFIRCFFFLLLFVAASVSQAQTLTTRYWPLSDGNSTIYTSSAFDGYAYTFLQSYGEDFDLYSPSATIMQLSYQDDTKQVIQKSFSSANFSPPIVLLDEALIAKGGKITRDVTIGDSSYEQLSCKVTTVIKPCGTVKVPAGTFNNCILVSVILSKEGENLNFEAFVLAPKVGIIRMGIVGEDEHLEWLNAISGYVNGESLGVLSDTTPPAVLIDSPASQKIVTGDQIYLQGRTTDLQSEVVSVLYQVGSTNSEGWQYASGTGNWSVVLTPAPGPVAVYIKAVDSQGNESAPVCWKFFYGVPRGFLPIVTDDSLGKVVGMREDWSYIGATNILTAVPNKGNAFLHWTLDGAVISSNKVLKFVMPDRDYPNLVANFIDMTSPTLVITSPVNNQRWSNNVLRITGKAADNSLIDTVMAEVIGSSAIGAETTNHFTNWWADLPLNPGTNQIRVVASDLWGKSTTNVVRVVYVLSDYLIVRSTGSDVYKLSYTKLLEISKPHFITAKSVNGYAFTGWSSNLGLGTNGSTIRFIMQSNLVLTANYADIARPTIKISSPIPVLTFCTNGSVTIKGTVADNEGIQAVRYSITPPGTIPAYDSTASIFTNGTWSANVALTPGSNVFYVKASDAAGNFSKVESRSIFYTVYKTLSVKTNGLLLGSVVGITNQARLPVGGCTKVTAVPARNQMFQYWSDESGKILSSSSSFTYVMPNSDTAVLQANFATNRFLAAQGTYAGLFFSTNELNVFNAGSCTFTLRNNGDYSGTINLLERSYPVAGHFLYDGTASIHLVRPGGLSPVDVTLQCSTGSNNFLKGEFQQTNLPVALFDAGLSQACTNSAFQGRYKLKFSDVNGFGASSGVLIVNPNGQTILVLSLLDGALETVTTSGYVQQGGYLPLFSTLYGRRGMTLGWLNLSTNSPSVTSQGVGWVKLPGNWKYHREGFNLTAEVEGTRW